MLSGPFCGARLKAAIDMLYDKTRSMFAQEQQEEPPTGERRASNFLYVDEVAHSCAKSICEELITSARATELSYRPRCRLHRRPTFGRPGRDIHKPDAWDRNQRYPQIQPHQARGTAIALGGTGSERIYVGDLSSGSQSTLLWILWLALKMLNHYEFADEWNKQPAVLLIDEIENHLHPTWQRRVVPALLKHFPGIADFRGHALAVCGSRVEGRSGPYAEAGCGWVVSASTNEHDIIGWTTDEILRTFMGVDEPTDQLTVNRATRLRELRGKETLSDAEAEEMTELRRQVNEDFISSSTPLEAQRERYGDMMLEFLRFRQSELSQDGS